ncbi:hypothetical protein FA15DRAFT_701787 [Coprinopsis marcescibilis]|uniref:C2H2-type domain-containing protein n=1 Tax=Coprinopsis marcescibilis TaxID=230819 RepID=A0A5C3LGD7_COPMA|nr:hypothetical protein FA15DRAFT_701787 [Coprinopsis marcescibilis]
MPPTRQVTSISEATNRSIKKIDPEAAKEARRLREAKVRQNRVPTRCALCDALISRAPDMKRHIDTVHLDIKAFVCTWEGCGLRFAQRGNLDTHIRRMHTFVKIPCPHEGCELSSFDKSSLIRHRLRVHGYTPMSRRHRNGIPPKIKPKREPGNKKRKRSKKDKTSNDEVTAEVPENIIPTNSACTAPECPEPEHTSDFNSHPNDVPYHRLPLTRNDEISAEIPKIIISTTSVDTAPEEPNYVPHHHWRPDALPLNLSAGSDSFADQAQEYEDLSGLNPAFYTYNPDLHWPQYPPDDVACFNRLPKPCPDDNTHPQVSSENVDRLQDTLDAGGSSFLGQAQGHDIIEPAISPDIPVLEDNLTVGDLSGLNPAFYTYNPDLDWQQYTLDANRLPTPYLDDNPSFNLQASPENVDWLQDTLGAGGSSFSGQVQDYDVFDPAFPLNTPTLGTTLDNTQTWCPYAGLQNVNWLPGTDVVPSDLSAGASSLDNQAQTSENESFYYVPNLVCFPEIDHNAPVSFDYIPSQEEFTFWLGNNHDYLTRDT